MTKRRSPMEMNIEILEKAMKNIKPTRLMNSVNMAGKPFKERINELKTKGLIEEIKLEEKEIKKDKRTKINYRTTSTGISIIRTLKEVTKSVG